MKKSKFLLLVFILLCFQVTLPISAAEENTPIHTGYRQMEPYWSFGENGDEQLAQSGFSTLPVAYDSREYGYVTSVKDQKSYGTCWAFATLAAAESSLIKSGLADKNIDLSEYHLAYFSYCANQDPLGNTDYDSYIVQESLKGKLNYGGNVYEAVEQLAKGCGPVEEAKLPYASALELHIPNPDLAFQSVYYIKNAYYADSSDINKVKNLVYQYGAATAGYYSDPSYYASLGETNTYYLPNIRGGNHGICIVGWDDNFSKENFKCTPPGDGAWLCKNSNVADNGYVWISYYTHIGEVLSMEFSSKENHDNNYQYDGCIAQTRGFSDVSPQQEGAVTSLINIFEAKKSDKYLEKIEGVSIHVNGNETYSVTIYVNPVINEDGIMTDYTYKSSPVSCYGGVYAGIRTVEIEEPIYLNKGDFFAIEVMGSDIENYAMSVSTGKGVEYMQAGECYMGMTKEGSTTYLDLSQSQYEATPRIKGFTSSTNIPCAIDVVLEQKELTLLQGERFALNASALIPAGGLAGVTYQSSNPAIASVSVYGEVIAHKPGECIITATCTYGEAAKSCKVQVKKLMATSLQMETYVNLKEGEKYVLSPVFDVDTTDVIEYISENSLVATVDEKGQVQGVGPGETVILAQTTDGSNLTAKCIVKVFSKENITENIYLLSDSISIPVGGFANLSVERFPNVVNDDRVAFIVSNPTVVSVENYRAIGLSPGKSYITVKSLDSGVTSTITITVYEVEEGKEHVEQSQQAAGIGTTFKYGNLIYKISGKNTVTVLGGKKKKVKTITIPSSVKYKKKTYVVTTVSNNAFSNYKKLTTIKIGTNVKEIGKSAFRGCSSLRSITIHSLQLTKLGRKAFEKVKENAIIKVPEEKLAFYKKLFKKGDFIKNARWKVK